MFSGSSRVSLGHLSMLPGPGGLECDIGSIGDIVSSKKSTLSLGMIKEMFLIKISNSLRTTDSTKIAKMSKTHGKIASPIESGS